MVALTYTQVLTVLVGLICLAGKTGTEPRFGGNRPARQSSFSGQNNLVSNSRTYRGRKQCIQVTKYAEARGKGCVSKYECNDECTKKKECKTRYKYKCTDYKRQECKDVWQNQCNGKRGKRDLTDQVEVDVEVEGLRGEVGRPEDEVHSRVKRLIETEVVYDQSYPVPPSDLPFASPSQGQKFSFASPPKSKTCWKKVRECKWVKYRSSCRNQPVKECSNKLVTVCKKKCKYNYYCNTCGSKPTTPKPVGPTTSRPKPTPKPVIGPPGTPQGVIILPPAPPSTLDVIIDARRNNVRRQKRKRGKYVP